MSEIHLVIYSTKCKGRTTSLPRSDPLKAGSGLGDGCFWRQAVTEPGIKTGVGGTVTTTSCAHTALPDGRSTLDPLGVSQHWHHVTDEAIRESGVMWLGDPRLQISARQCDSRWPESTLILTMLNCQPWTIPKAKWDISKLKDEIIKMK